MISFCELSATSLLYAGLVYSHSKDVGHPLFSANQNWHLTLQSPVRWANMSVQFQQFEVRNLFSRQETCITGYELCPDGVSCCPVGDTCISDGCCDAGEEQCGSSYCYDPSTSVCCPDGANCPIGQDCVGTFQCCPAGEIPCGDNGCYNPATHVCCISGAYAASCALPKQCCGNDYCYSPDTQQCCGDQGACLLDLTCCENECCGSAGYCGSDGYCHANSCTVTSTSRTTSYFTFTMTITKLIEEEEEEEAPDFTCPPITATNDANETLELGDDCSLTLYHGSTEASFTSSSNTAVPSLKPRAVADDPNCLATSISIVRYTVYTMTTTSTTVTETETPEGFSCPPMTVTNIIGDELTLDEECKLEFSPGSNASSGTSSTSDGSSTATRGSGNTGTNGIARLSCAHEMLLGFSLLAAICIYVV